MPDVNGDEFNVSFRTPPGSRARVHAGQGARDRARSCGSSRRSSSPTSPSAAASAARPTTGSVFVRARATASKRSLADIQNDLRGKLRSIPGVRAVDHTGSATIFGGVRQPIQVNVQGPEASRLKIAADAGARGRALACRAWPSRTRARMATSRSSTCASTASRPGAPGSASAPSAATLQPLFSGQRATRVGGSRRASRTTSS